MNNNNYLFYRKYFDFEKSDLSRQDCINEILEYNNDLEYQDISSLTQEFNRVNNIGDLNKRRNIENLKFINKSILRSDLVKIDMSDCRNTFINLKTTYPGLLLGTGYSHDYKASSDDVTQEGFKIGFYFDYTTGMPVIMGSSVKGMLRAYFPQNVVSSKNGRFKKPKYSKEKEKFIKEELKSLGIDEDVDIDILEREIFDGLRPKRDNEGNIINDEYEKKIFKPFSIYKRDIFLETIPISIQNNKNRLFEDDALAVHKENLLKNPTPIKFLKVASDVEYEFQFKLFDSEIYPTITKDIKRELFKSLILNFGVGAKTNVGYGKFTEKSVTPSNHASNTYRTNENLNPRLGEQNHPPVNELVFKEEIPSKAKDALKKNTTFSGRITRIDGNLIQISFVVKEATYVVYKQMERLKNPNNLEVKINTPVAVKIGLDYAYPNNLNCQVIVS